jgi:hypothetical protein
VREINVFDILISFLKLEGIKKAPFHLRVRWILLYPIALILFIIFIIAYGFGSSIYKMTQKIIKNN